MQKQCYIIVKFPGFDNDVVSMQENGLILLIVVEFKGK